MMEVGDGTKPGFWLRRKVFVTGATGVIGSWLTKELVSRDAFVVALIRDNDPQAELFRSRCIEAISIVNGALEDFQTLERAITVHEIDTVFHLGAQTLVGVANRSPLGTFESNIRGTYNLLEACRLHRDLVQQVVLASSDKAYGERLGQPYTEDMALQGQTPYEVSKSCADLIGQAYHRTYGLAIGIVRCGNVYGGGDLNWSRIVPGTIRSLLFGQSPVIRSDGTYLRDYIYVKDVVRAYLGLAECLTEDGIKGQAFNFSTENPVTVLEVVRIIQGLMNQEKLSPKILNAAHWEIRDQRVSAEKARQLLSWRAQFDLESGLRETVAWYEHFFGAQRR